MSIMLGSGSDELDERERDSARAKRVSHADENRTAMPPRLLQATNSIQL